MYFPCTKLFSDIRFVINIFDGAWGALITLENHLGGHNASQSNRVNFCHVLSRAVKPNKNYYETKTPALHIEN